MSKVRPRNLTLVGLPRADEHQDEIPFALRQYDAVMSYTPSHERSLGTPTPVHVQPSRRLTPEQVRAHRAAVHATQIKRRSTQVMARPEFMDHPGPLAMVLSALVVMYVVAILVFGVF